MSAEFRTPQQALKDKVDETSYMLIRGTLLHASLIAGANIPDNEPGEYARGRLAARDEIKEAISKIPMPGIK